MTNMEPLELLQQGGDAWNTWRAQNRSIKLDLVLASLRGANLSGADLSGADLMGAILEGANLSGANLGFAVLRKADLSEADLSEAALHRATLDSSDLRRTNLRRADLRGANLRGTNLSRLDLRGVDLREAELNGADLSEAKLVRANLVRANLEGASLKEANLEGAYLVQANLIDALFDCADITDAQLWETQRSGWSIKGILCRRIFWDRGANEATDYEEGEFEHIFKEKPRIMLRYPGGMSPIDLFALPLVVERLQAEYLGCVLQVRSVQNDAGGALVTITVEDIAGRGPEAFGQELVRIQTKLECIVQERDYLRQRLESAMSEGISKVAASLALPKQGNNFNGPIGQIHFGGPTMSRDTFNNSGQAGAFGPGAHAHDNTFQQIQDGGVDLPKLAEELGRLRAAMKGEATGTREQDKAIGAVADAEEAAAKGDGSTALRYLKAAGTWTLGVAEKIGVDLAVEALTKAM